MESKKAEDGETDKLEVLERLLSDERKRSEELLTRLKYSQADLENYRKRADRELREAAESLANGLVSKLVVVADELELALKHAEGGANGELTEGIRMVSGNLRAALQSVGVEPIEALGKPFDPALHEAVEKSQGAADGSDRVVEVLRTGYMFRGKLLRPSLVKVELARKSAQEEAKSDE
ncbi:MAG: nucleotide exchange factor GrpE [Nitrososphaerota archaeon]|jgi:molecular chaperone GrpE|nr:nucleotide exchange factor GrpE [Nitrososphaerota archaeon]MDG6941551.1 nucleotide exchange factor GrpE [Nitrososphaerota archaeon]MDG6951092.1 nucleotide exchange factor GrpE [Nitrososphaerota archaeon]